MFPTAGGATDRLAELLLHGTLAALVVEGLVHWGPVTGPTLRYACRVTALGAPLVLGALFALALPWRREPWFQDLSLFVSARWDLLRVGEVSVRAVVIWTAAAGGLTLLLRDAIGVARDAVRARREWTALPRIEPPAGLRSAAAAVAARLGIRTPRIEVLVTPKHLLQCRGVRATRIVVSTAALDALGPAEREAAVAHELAHLAHRDLVGGWCLLGLRALQCFNPFAQAVGRRAVQELEWRADDRAVDVTGAPLALAQALVRCARQRGDRFLGLAGHGRLRALEERCRRLLERRGPSDEGGAAAAVAMLWAGLFVLLVLVQ
jgi:Zn-dependent protease with chaperone function